ncbi:Phosphoribosylaminoimidazole-succinocarboxamide synthase [Chitinispirillum alkaliphilum]|nr:Phosphoribosylaminoimidazole-succinocarboxamide synthase [Chitinispirillum alkaliphilum]
MVKNQKLEKPILTPTTKSDIHDEPISATEIVKRGIIDQTTWDKLEKIALQLFSFGSDFASNRGLILVDTKYELGVNENGDIIIVDELHTPDSSRYWIKDSYETRLAQNLEPENIDKEFLRLWYKNHCDPYNDEILPEATEELITELSVRYIKLYEMITGSTFDAQTDIPITDRIKTNLSQAGVLK